MMGHRVKLMPGYTFRLNLCCANPYNADFDGDEMNLHVPQSPAATADVATLMMVSHQILSPQANRPVMGIVQDSLLGAHLFSINDFFLTRKQVCHILSHLKYMKKRIPEPCIVRPMELWTGKQLLSILFPTDFTLGLLSVHSTEEALKQHLVFRNGQLLSGILKKNSLGTSAGGLIDMLYRSYGSGLTTQWMSEIQRMVNSWLALIGFSVGIKDCVLGSDGEQKVKDRIKLAMDAAMGLVEEVDAVGGEEKKIVETTVIRILSKCLMHTGGIVDEELGNDNAIRKMVQAGSKGNPVCVAPLPRAPLLSCLVVWLFGCLVVWLFGCLVVWLLCFVLCFSIGAR